MIADLPSARAQRDLSAGALPLTVLTGFLGAGKTSLVNRILRGAHGRRIAVLVNEFGAVGIDGGLIIGATCPVIELANGCICCATQGDLHRALAALLAAQADLDGVLVETSGLADPVSIVDTIEARRYPEELRVAGIVTVIDAENFDANLERAEAAMQQIVGGDLLLLNKVDLVEPAVPALIARGIAKINPHARLFPSVRCDVPLELVVDVRRHDRPHRPHTREHRHGDMESAVLSAAAPLDPERFDAWLAALPASIFRAKGFVRLAGHERPVAVHVVGRRVTAEPAPSRADTTGAILVVIGHGLRRDELEAALRRCAPPGARGNAEV